MKYNLETIKEKLLDGNIYTHGHILHEIKGLEKELREKIKNLIPQKQYYDFEVERILKEILGDKE